MGNGALGDAAQRDRSDRRPLRFLPYQLRTHPWNVRILRRSQLLRGSAISWRRVGHRGLAGGLEIWIWRYQAYSCPGPLHSREREFGTGDAESGVEIRTNDSRCGRRLPAGQTLCDHARGVPSIEFIVAIGTSVLLRIRLRG